jgi:nitrite reductase/ring-hydroxylating ferredoxin subunit
VIYSVADAADLPPGTMMHVELDGRMIALYNYDGDFYATDDICTHRRASSPENRRTRRARYP